MQRLECFSFVTNFRHRYAESKLLATRDPLSFRKTTVMEALLSRLSSTILAPIFRLVADHLVCIEPRSTGFQTTPLHDPLCGVRDLSDDRHIPADMLRTQGVEQVKSRILTLTMPKGSGFSVR